ncbi:MAG TPA: ZIP family zinc transporter [Actinomycetes bacterium]|nr:ZIP family zinc transporter [Actinomycetes bacterium]
MTPWADMAEALLVGALAASTLLIGAVVAVVVQPSARVKAIVMALGAGILIGSVSYELVDEALVSLPLWQVSLMLFVGSATFLLGARWIEHAGGGRRKHPRGHDENTQGQAIVLGSILDGIPESVVLGLTVLQGSVSLPLFVGVALSNLPEGVASTSGLRASGWSVKRIVGMWSAVIAASAISCALGYLLLEADGGGVAQAFAAGALLTMVADTMLPDSYAVEKTWTGGLVVTGFALAVALGAL